LPGIGLAGSNANQTGRHHLGVKQCFVMPAAVGTDHSDGPLPGGWKPIDQRFDASIAGEIARGGFSG
jgi:hypothetical protein